MKVNAREKKVLIIGGVAAALILLFYSADTVIPSPGSIAAEVANKKKLLANYREVIGKENSYKALIDQYRKRLDQDRTRLLDGENPNVAGAALQSLLKDLADQNGVELIRRDIQPEKKPQDHLIKVSVHIDTNCQPDQLVPFITAIENYSKYLTVDDLTINSYRIQKRTEIRPSMTVSGYIAAPESKPGDKGSRVP